LDPLGIIFNGLASSFIIIIAVLPLTLFVVEVDPGYFVLSQNSSFSFSIKCFRLFVIYVSLTEIVANVGLAHLTLIMLTITSKTCLYHLQQQKMCQKKYGDKSDLEVYKMLAILFKIRRYFGFFHYGPWVFIMVNEINLSN
jgi:hypothetical protein